MSDMLERLRRRIDSAEKLDSIVRMMKTLAASGIGQYETAVNALADYYSAVRLGLVVCLRSDGLGGARRSVVSDSGIVGAVVFGSDQGFVGRFNEVLVDFVLKTLGPSTENVRVWGVGERVCERLQDVGLAPVERFAVPNSVNTISWLVGQVLLRSEVDRAKEGIERIYLFHNQSLSGGTFQPVGQRLLPLDEQWRRELDIRWPTENLPEVLIGLEPTLRALIREYLFVSLFRACAESMASENACRLAAMQRAEENIGGILEDLHRTFHRVRQRAIDEELFDVISGFEALSKDRQ